MFLYIMRQSILMIRFDLIFECLPNDYDCHVSCHAGHCYRDPRGIFC